ncbi:hypothetical protein JCM1840_004512 [Sporobolomyces johnsonii]
MQVDQQYSGTPSPPAEPSASSAGAPPMGEQAPLITVCHSTSIHAVHRLWSSSLSEQANAERYGAALGVHGHVYEFRVEFRGPVCKKTGQIMGTDLLEDVISLALTEVLSHKHLDSDISFFLSRPSTLENVCLFAWRNISVIMAPHPFDLVEVSVETEPCPRNEHSRALKRSKVTFKGEMVNVPSQSC